MRVCGSAWLPVLRWIRRVKAVMLVRRGAAVARVLDEDELIEHWTLVGDELALLSGRTGPVKLGLAFG